MILLLSIALVLDAKVQKIFGNLQLFTYFCNKMRKEERYDRILAYFREQMPNVNTELEFGSIFQLLVAVVLSAQCTDKRINQVTPELFRHYPDARSMAMAEPEDILDYIRSVSYPNAKASRDFVEVVSKYYQRCYCNLITIYSHFHRRRFIVENNNSCD